MSKGRYRVIDGVTRKVKKRYVVVDGVTRKLKKSYRVVDGVTHLTYSSGTYVVHPTVALTANSSNGYVTTASTYNSSTYAAWKAFNKEYSSAYGWVSKASSTDSSPHIKLYIPSAVNIVKVSIANRTHASYVNGVIAATIQGSVDGSTWTTICTISGRDGATSALLTDHECIDTGTLYQYVKINPTNWKNKGVSGGNSYVAIGEIYITCLVED